MSGSEGRWFVLLEDGGCQEVKEGGADSDGQAGERRLGVWVTHRDGRLGFTDEAWTEELLYFYTLHYPTVRGSDILRGGDPPANIHSPEGNIHSPE